MARQPVRIAFSLRSLLAIVVVLSLVFAWLFPWLAHVRERQRRVQCQGNQKELALAIKTYEEQNRKYPRSAFGSNFAAIDKSIVQFVPGSNSLQNPAPYSFLVEILPYLDHSHIFDKIDFTQSAFATANWQHWEHVLPTLLCPSFSYQRTSNRSRAYNPPTGVNRPALTQYKTLSATTVDVLAEPLALLLPETKLKAQTQYGEGGALHPYASVRALHAKAVTILFCETREKDLAAWADGGTVGIWGLLDRGAPGPPYTERQVLLNNVHQSPPTAAPMYTWAGGHAMTWGPSSLHPGIVNHTFADGSTKALSGDIDPNIYAAWITRAYDDNGDPLGCP